MRKTDIQFSVPRSIYANTYIAINGATEKRESRNKALLIATYDFSTFYTNVSHNKLKNVMRDLISFFEDGEKQVILVTKFGAAWNDNKNKFKIIFDKASLKLAINFIADNYFLKSNNLSIQQITEIPMRPDLVPSMSNLFLHYYKTNC